MTVICCGFWTKKFQNLKKCDRKVTKNQSMKIDENTNTAKILLTIRIQPKSIQITGKPESLNLLKLEKAENRNLNAFFIKIDFFSFSQLYCYGFRRASSKRRQDRPSSSIGEFFDGSLSFHVQIKATWPWSTLCLSVYPQMHFEKESPGLIQNAYETCQKCIQDRSRNVFQIRLKCVLNAS